MVSPSKVVLQLLSLSLASVWAQTTRTVAVDDSDRAIRYAVPEGSESRWTAVNSKDYSSCSAVSCWSRSIDAGQTTGGTWHEGSDAGTATFAFNGTGVDVYLILRDTAGARTDVSFLVDGETKGSLSRSGGAPTADGEAWLYNFNAFSIANLTNGPHTLVIQDGAPSGIVLDYIRYTQALGSAFISSSSSSSISATPSPTSTEVIIPPIASIGSATTSRNPNAAETGFQVDSYATYTPPAGPIVAGVVGGVVLIIVIAMGIIGWKWLKRRSLRMRAAATSKKDVLATDILGNGPATGNANRTSSYKWAEHTSGSSSSFSHELKSPEPGTSYGTGAVLVPGVGDAKRLSSGPHGGSMV